MLTFLARNSLILTTFVTKISVNRDISWFCKFPPNSKNYSFVHKFFEIYHKPFVFSHLQKFLLAKLLNNSHHAQICPPI